MDLAPKGELGRGRGDRGWIGQERRVVRTGGKSGEERKEGEGKGGERRGPDFAGTPIAEEIQCLPGVVTAMNE